MAQLEAGLAELGIVAGVDHEPRQGLAVELDPPVVGAGAEDHDVGQDGGRGLGREAVAGARVERLELGHHLLEILAIDAAEPQQGGPVGARQKGQVVEQPPHRRVEPVALGELQCQAFGEIAGADADRLAALQQASGRRHPFEARPHPPRDLAVRLAQVALVVDPVGELGREVPELGIGAQHAELPPQRLAQGGRFAEPFLQAAQIVAARRLAPGVELLVERPRGAGLLPLAGCIARRACRARAEHRVAVHRQALGALARSRDTGLGELQKRVLGHLAQQRADELLVRELQEANRLLQLRRQHQALRLPNIEAETERHGHRPQRPLAS